jgi:AcrR family transcriptional regulator
VNTAAETPTLLRKPMRADALRNYEKVLAAAREAFEEGGESTALEEIARRAGVGIGTLYRHFPSRQALLEALYVGEVEELCRSAADLGDGRDPWEALNLWFEAFVPYIATKQALAHELQKYLDPGARLFPDCRAALFAAGEPLLRRAQDAGVVRSDVDIGQVIQMVISIAKGPGAVPGQSEHLVRVALDGLRHHPAA